MQRDFATSRDHAGYRVGMSFALALDLDADAHRPWFLQRYEWAYANYWDRSSHCRAASPPAAAWRWPPRSFGNRRGFRSGPGHLQHQFQLQHHGPVMALAETARERDALAVAVFPL
jgi:hypothetical protein